MLLFIKHYTILVEFIMENDGPGQAPKEPPTFDINKYSVQDI